MHDSGNQGLPPFSGDFCRKMAGCPRFAPRDTARNASHLAGGEHVACNQCQMLEIAFPAAFNCSFSVYATRVSAASLVTLFTTLRSRAALRLENLPLRRQRYQPFAGLRMARRRRQRVLRSDQIVRVEFNFLVGKRRRATPEIDLLRDRSPDHLGDHLPRRLPFPFVTSDLRKSGHPKKKVAREDPRFRNVAFSWRT